MPLKLISNFVSSFIKRNSENEPNTTATGTNTASTTTTTVSTTATPKEIFSTKSSSLASISFSPTITIQSLWNGNKKDDSSDVTTIKSSAETERWTLHQEQLIYWQNQPPVFDPFPTFGINEYELLETLGEFFRYIMIHMLILLIR
jgi:hypothetical protein